MSVSVPRKDAIGTVSETAGWLQRHSILILAFFALGVIDALGQELVLFSLLGVVLLIYLNGVAHLYAYGEVTSAAPSFAEASSRVLDRFLSLVGIHVAYVIAVFVGLILLVLPGIYLAVRLSLSFPACVIDDRDALDSLKTSWDVAQGNLLKILGIWIIMVFGTAAVALLVAAFAGLGEAFYVAALAVSAVVSAILLPIAEMAYARVYLENRESEPAAATERGGAGRDERGSATDAADW